MDSKQDYFISPAPRNFLNQSTYSDFFSPFRLLWREDDPLLLSPLTSPFNRNSNSSFSPYSPSKAQHQLNDKSNKLGIKEFGPKKIQAILSFDEEDQSQQDIMQTPHSNQIKIANVETAPTKKYDLRFIESSQKHQSFKDKQKGLRSLSKQAFEILKISEPLTYQGVAERIIQENQDINAYPEKIKERQSIRRRVYDALNVLISIGLLQKQGKKIFITQQQQINVRKKKFLSQELTHKLKAMQVKKERLERMKLLQNSIQRLLQRKIENDEKMQSLIIGKQLKQDIQILNEQVKMKSIACGDLDSLALLKFSMGV